MGSDILAPGFKPESLTVAKLRRLLTEYDVEYPAHAKKAELTKLFKRKIKPMIPQLRKQQMNVKASSEGISRISRKKKKDDVVVLDDEDKDSASSSASETSSESESTSESESDSDSESEIENAVEDESNNSFQNARIKRKPETETEELEQNDVNEKPHLDFSYKKLKSSDLDHLKSIKVGGKMADILQSAIKDMEEEEESNSSSPSAVSENIEISSESDNEDEGEVPVHVSETEQEAKEEPVHTEPVQEEQTQAEPAQEEETQISKDVDEDGDIEIKDYDEKENVAEETSNINIESLANGTSHNDTIGNNEQVGQSSFSLEQQTTPLKFSTDHRPPIPNDIDNSAVFTGKLTSENSFLFDDHQDNEEEVKPALKEEKAHVIEILDDELNATDIEDEQSTEEESIDAVVQDKPRAIHNLITFFFKLVLFTLVIAIGMVIINLGLWYREQRVLIGYCGQEIHQKSVHFEKINLPHREEIEAILEPYKPQCLECPENGLCYKHMELKCKPGYRLEESLLSLHGVFPVSSYCVKDDRREKMVKEVVSKTLELLRIKNAQISCGDSKDDIESGLTEEILRGVFNDAKADWVSEEQFEEIWSQVLKELESEPEMTIRQVSI